MTLSPSASVGDPDDQNQSSATVSITAGTFSGDGDTLAATTTGTSITASYNSATEVLSLTGTDTLAHYRTVLRSVTFTTANHNPTNFGANPSRTLSWVLNDAAATGSNGIQSTTVTTSISITPINDAPTLSGTTASVGFTENGAAVTLSPSAAVTDIDDQNLSSATASITAGTFSGDGDTLAAATTGTSITASYNSATGVPLRLLLYH